MILNFVGDIHLGLSRKAFTTRESCERYDRAILETARSAICYEPQAVNIQLGDLFDKSRNTDVVALQGHRFADMFQVILAGNHDLCNSAYESTLELIDNSDTVFPNFLGGVKYRRVEYDNTKVVFLPYCYTQEQFEQSLECVYDVGGNILCLHTNYDNKFAQGETENNLSRERAEWLLDKFDLIISGHEHNYKEDFDGRLIMLGSIFPMSSAEFTDKFILTYDTQTKRIVRVPVWDKSKAFTLNPKDFAGLPEGLAFFNNIQFLKVEGEAETQEDLQAILVWVAKAWKEMPNILQIDTSKLSCKEGQVARTIDATDFVSAEQYVIKHCPDNLIELLKELDTEKKLEFQV